MGFDHPIFVLVSLGMAFYFGKLFVGDVRDFKTGKQHPKAFPGATPTSWRPVVVGVVGALVLLAMETAGEYALGVEAEQKDVAALVLVGWLVAAFVEELIFRGYLVVTNAGKLALWGSALCFSGLFALAHPFLWTYEPITEGGDNLFQWHFTLKAFWSVLCVFALSMWFYAVRFLPSNKNRSIIPCIAAHCAKNLGVFAVKLVQGHIVGLW